MKESGQKETGIEKQTGSPSFVFSVLCVCVCVSLSLFLCLVVLTESLVGSALLCVCWRDGELKVKLRASDRNAFPRVRRSRCVWIVKRCLAL